jgi:hypothetical protein
MDARQAAASANSDDSVHLVFKALVNFQVTATAAATVSASTPVDRSAAADAPPGRRPS